MKEDNFEWRCLLYTLRPSCERQGLQELYARLWNDMDESGAEQQLIAQAAKIVAGNARREESRQGIRSIFHLLNGGRGEKTFYPHPVEELQYPTEQKAPEEALSVRLKACLEELLQTKGDPEWALEVCRKHLSYYPSAVPGVSLYQKARLETCLAGCLRGSGKEKPFLLMTCGLPGIQKFLYTISGKGVLKSLRSRSFYLDLLEEHLMTELLDRLGLCRAHVLYVGGGSSYALLPNTSETINVLETCLRNINRWLRNRFSGALQFLYAWEPCSGDELQNKELGTYQEIFARLDQKLEERKNRRFDAEDLRRLNAQKMHDAGRECRVCAGSSLPVDGDGLCEVCREFRDVSAGLVNDGRVAAICGAVWNEQNHLTVPSADGTDWFVYMLEEDRLKDLPKAMADTPVRVYAADGKHLPLPLGAYAYTADGVTIPTFEELAKWARGIKRLGVLRADVDNLGSTFTKGFERNLREGTCGSGLALTASLSQLLTQFFKMYLTGILKGKYGQFHLLKKDEGSTWERKAIVVYAGGDDMFLVGSWNEIVELSVDIYNCFRAFTDGKLTFSAGVGLFPYHYPIYAMAEDTAILESEAKNIDRLKNGLTLFGMEMKQDAEGTIRSTARHKYHWPAFIKNVVQNKLHRLEAYFDKAFGQDSGSGTAFLYQLKRFAEQLDKNPAEKMNLARFAYLLARMEPDKKDLKLANLYTDLSIDLYRWVQNNASRGMLLTAIELYLCLTRKSREDGA